MGKITALSAKVLSKPGRHGDGEGLYLNIAPSGSKSWVQRIVVDGRRRDIGLSPYPAVGLASARAIAHDNRTAIAEGRDPVAEKRESAQAGCMTTSLVYHAAARGHKITSVGSTLEGNLYLQGFLGMDEKVRSGYNDIKVTMKVEGDVPEGTLQELIQIAKDRSPVYDIVTHPVNVTIELKK